MTEREEILNAIKEVYIKLEDARLNEPTDIKAQVGFELDLQALRVRLNSITQTPEVEEEHAWIA